MNFRDGDRNESAEAALVVVATGWVADTARLSLTAPGVQLDSDGHIRVDQYLQTTAAHVFAAGDVTGRLMLVPGAIEDGFVAATNAVEGPSLLLPHRVTPSGSFTYPEYAEVGLTEAEARKTHAVVTTHVPFAAAVRPTHRRKDFRILQAGHRPGELSHPGMPRRRRARRGDRATRGRRDDSRHASRRPGSGRGVLPHLLRGSRARCGTRGYRAPTTLECPGGTRPPARRRPGINDVNTTHRHRVVIIGGGFGGLSAARGLRRADAEVTLIDRTNHHLFQPLLYQLATGILSEGDIAPPLREVLRDQRNAQVVFGEVVEIHLGTRRIVVETLDRRSELVYDSLIVATGASQSYFGHPEFATHAPGMKTIDDALEIRGRILGAFEMAEREPDPVARRRFLTFVIVGAGPTGVELAGQLVELSRHTLRHNFRNIDPAEARIVLLDAAPTVLGAFPDSLRKRAMLDLRDIGVELHLGIAVTHVDEHGLDTNASDVRVAANRSRHEDLGRGRSGLTSRPIDFNRRRHGGRSRGPGESRG